MTREEAIEVLNGILKLNYREWWDEECDEAIEMAIESLSAPSGDLISRADAIRWVKTECNPYGKPTLDYDSGLKVIEHLKKMPSALPSADAIPHGRLIDADSLISDLEEWKENPNNDDSSVDLVNHFIGIIRSAPSADAVSREAHHDAVANRITDMEERGFVWVVRCKDCKHYSVEGETTRFGWCGYWNKPTDEMRSCSDGERRKL